MILSLPHDRNLLGSLVSSLVNIGLKAPSLPLVPSVPTGIETSFSEETILSLTKYVQKILINIYDS